MRRLIKDIHWKFFPFYLLLLPLYFISHNSIYTFNSIDLLDALQLYVVYLFGTSLVALLFYWITRSIQKACLAAFLVMLLYLFFGGLHDTLKQLLPSNHLVTRYVFLLPFLFVLAATLLWYLYKSNKQLNGIIVYCNILFLVLLLMDTPAWTRSLNEEKSSELKFAPVFNRPDVHFFIADGYSDSTALQQAFNFNNQAFLKKLRNRGFKILHSKANYNFTPFSVGAILNMDYYDRVEGSNSNIKDIVRTRKTILNNNLVSFFQDNGYTIKNFSIFNFADRLSPLPSGKQEIGLRYVQSQTLLSRLERDLFYHYVLRFPESALAKKWAYFDNVRNKKNIELLRQELDHKDFRPRFTYTHVLMPHYPYYFDSSGRPYKLEFLAQKESTNKRRYLQYLRYSNKVFLQIIDEILTKSKTPPVIVFMSDHGFREFEAGEKFSEDWLYSNLNAVYFPGKNYEKFYKGISGVNQFRVILNSVFNQQLALLPDSTIFIRE